MTGQGRITPDQMQSHIEHCFEVALGTTVIEVDFDYAPRHPDNCAYTNEISLSLFDPTGGRGARHNKPDFRIVLTADYTSKGCLPGPPHPGTWTVSIDVHRIMAQSEVLYRLLIKTDSTPVDGFSKGRDFGGSPRF